MTKTPSLEPGCYAPNNPNEPGSNYCGLLFKCMSKWDCEEGYGDFENNWEAETTNLLRRKWLVNNYIGISDYNETRFSRIITKNTCLNFVEQKRQMIK